jgi:hypothetical protein
MILVKNDTYPKLIWKVLQFVQADSSTYVVCQAIAQSDFSPIDYNGYYSVNINKFQRYNIYDVLIINPSEIPLDFKREQKLNQLLHD